MSKKTTKTHTMEYKHFSHHHPLTLHRIQPNQQPQLCHGCRLPCNNTTTAIFTCSPCNFFLHEHCGNANRYIKHPSHAPHPLVLVPTPTYCSGSFLCNGCGAPGSSFSYCCPLCEIDLHVNCAFLPLKSTSNSHQHELSLGFVPPSGASPNSPDYCRVCRKELNFTTWFYFCDRAECDFRAHTFCSSHEVTPGMYQDNQAPEDANTGVHEAETTEWTPEAMAIEIARMRMEFEMAQALGNIIAYYPARR